MIEKLKQLHKEKIITLDELRGWLDAFRITLDEYLYITK